MLLIDELKKGQEFTTTEQKIGDYILQYPKEVKKMIITELASVTYTSPSAISRLCKKVGLTGFSELKLKLATEINTFNLKDQRIKTEIPINANTTTAEIADVFLNLHYQSLTDVYNILDIQKLDQIAELLFEADEILIFGKGVSLALAQVFQYNLLRIGLNANLQSLDGFQELQGRRKDITKKRVAFIISHYVRGEHVATLFDELKHANTDVILLCGNDKSPWVKHAKMIINVYSEETKSKIGAFSSRASMLFILDVLYMTVFNLDYDEHLKIIQDAAMRDLDRNKKLQELKS